MSEENIEQLQTYITALENDKKTLTEDLAKCVNVIHGILDVLGIDPNETEKAEVRTLIKTGIKIFQDALINRKEFANKFSFTQEALEIAQKYPKQ